MNVAYYVDKSGQVVASEDDPEVLAASGYTPATDEDIDRHNSDFDYEQKGIAGQAAETIGTGVNAMIRGAESGLDALGVDTGVHRDEEGNTYALPGAANEGVFGEEAELAAERHPFAAGVGQAALAAPLGVGAGVAAAGLGAGALGAGAAGMGAESLAGGYASEAENAWVADREFSQEAALTNVGAGLLVGGGVMGAGALAGAAARGATRLGRNLLTEAEHTASARAARDLLDGAPSKRGPKSDISSAADIAARGPDDAGVAYLREHADELADDIAGKQAKAAQELLDTYGEMAPLRQSREQVDELIPAAQVEQARWVTNARREVLDALEGVPDDVAAPVRERLSALGEGADPARWFTEASEASDELLRASAKARRSGVDAGPDLSGAGSADDMLLAATPQRVPVSEQLAQAKRLLDDGLKDEGIWGSAGKFEGQRARGFERRYGEHIDAFEEAFTAEVDGVRKIDPAKFRKLIDAAEEGGQAAQALARTLESARVTADVAQQFGRKAEAQRIRDAITAIERTSQQGKVVSAARSAVARETKSATQSALDWLSREGARTLGDEAVDYAVNVATAGLVPRFARNAVSGAVKRAFGGKGAALGEAAQGALGRLGKGAGQDGSVRLGMHVRGAETFAGLHPEAQKLVAYAADGAAGKEINAASRAEMGEAINRAAAARKLPAEVADAARQFVASMPDERAWTGTTARKYGELMGKRGDGAKVLEDFELGQQGAAPLPTDPNLRRIWSEPKLWEAFQRGIAEGQRKAGQGGAVGVAAGPNFGLGDVAKSPMGAVTGLGAGAVGARELYLSQQDEARTGTFTAVKGLAQSARASIERAVNGLLSRPTDTEARGSRIEPPQPARVTPANYDATRDHIERMALEPAYFADVMAASFGSMPDAAPEVYAALSAEAAKTVQYLAAVAPGGKSGGPFGQRIPVGEDEVWEFNERFRALTDPDFVTEELAAGRLSAQAIESFELMRPKHYAHLQRTVFERLRELDEQGIAVTVQAREQIDVALNIDGGGDPALTWKVAERALAAQQRKNAMAPQQASTNDEHAEAMTSGALATLGNGASAIAQTG